MIELESFKNVSCLGLFWNEIRTNMAAPYPILCVNVLLHIYVQ
jgi:hypothetical protein